MPATVSMPIEEFDALREKIRALEEKDESERNTLIEYGKERVYQDTLSRIFKIIGCYKDGHQYVWEARGSPDEILARFRRLWEMTYGPDADKEDEEECQTSSPGVYFNDGQ
jgi:hypothetical protein